jgi:uroporphyrin-III C-methyltransferase
VKTGIVGICIALLIGVLGLFQFEEFQKNFRQIQSNLSKLDEKMDSELKRLQNELNTLKTQVQANAIQISTVPKSPAQDEKIAEIKYNVFLANTRLKMAQDIKGALQLLMNVNTQLESFADPNSEHFRALVNQDIEHLKQLNPPNLKTLLEKIDSIVAETKTLSVNGLQVKGENTISTTSSSENSSSQNSSHWKDTLTKNLHELKDLIKIRHHEKPVEPLLSETEQSMIQQNLFALFAEIRLAIMMQDDDIFHQTLSNTKDWLLSYYDKDPKLKTILNSLQTLADTHFQVEIPNLTSYAEINSFGENK